MTAAFIIHIEVDGVDPSTLQIAAEEITDAVDSVYPVISVAPWARPVTAPAMPGLGAPAIPPFPSTGL